MSYSFVAMKMLVAFVAAAMQGCDLSENNEDNVADSPDRSTTIPPFETDLGYATCPIARLVAESAPESQEVFEGWASTMIGQMLKTWVEGGSPKGPEVNDHNYGTVLGKGNTLGFAWGWLELNSMESVGVPDKYRVGMFGPQGEGRRFPAVARFSDFGSDDSSARLGRMAVKIPAGSLGAACAEDSTEQAAEINLLTTSDLSVFPLADYTDLRAFIQGSAPQFSSLIATLYNGLAAILGALWYDYALTSRSYYSQLPFAVGDSAAMRFSFVPIGTKQTASSQSKEDWRSAIDKALNSGPQVFEFHVQFHDDPSSTAVQTGGANEWDQTEYPTYTVGRLVLPQQDLDGAGVSTQLMEALTQLKQSEWGSNTATWEKRFRFHPALTIDDHRPVGQTNQFRRYFYAQQAAARMASMLGTDNSPLQMPFSELGSWFDSAINRSVGDVCSKFPVGEFC